MNKAILITAALSVTIGIAGGYWFATDSTSSRGMKQESSDSRKVLFWRNPMNPAITSPVFTQDEMGMDYIAVYAGGSKSGPAGTVTIDPVVVQNIGVRTATVTQRTLARKIKALGHVEFNEKRLARLHPKTSGWIETMEIEETGTLVKQGTVLLSIYSPELVAAQQEYVVALRNAEQLNNAVSTSLLDSARERLALFDVPAHQIKALKKSRQPMRSIHIHSPFKGRIMNIGVRKGQYITPKNELYLIADLSRIWVYVDIYEDDLPWLKIGDSAKLQVRAAPGQTFLGKISFIYPIQDRKTHTVRVRMAFDNPDLILKPGMFANIMLQVDPHHDAIVVPSAAIVRSGKREQVFIAMGQGRFEPREVVLGINADGYTQILQGVTVGEQVVVSSQFLIDSESKLNEATAKMIAIDPMTDDQTIDAGDTDMDMGDMDVNNVDELNSQE